MCSFFFVINISLIFDKLTGSLETSNNCQEQMSNMMDQKKSISLAISESHQYECVIFIRWKYNICVKRL